MNNAVPTPQEHLERVDAAIANGEAGMSSMSRDGTAVTWNRKQLLEERDYWQAKADAADAKRSRPIMTMLNPGGGGW